MHYPETPSTSFYGRLFTDAVKSDEGAFHGPWAR